MTKCVRKDERCTRATCTCGFFDPPERLNQRRPGDFDVPDAYWSNALYAAETPITAVPADASVIEHQVAQDIVAALGAQLDASIMGDMDRVMHEGSARVRVGHDGVLLTPNGVPFARTTRHEFRREAQMMDVSVLGSERAEVRPTGNVRTTAEFDIVGAVQFAIGDAVQFRSADGITTNMVITSIAIDLNSAGERTTRLRAEVLDGNVARAAIPRSERDLLVSHNTHARRIANITALARANLIPDAMRDEWLHAGMSADQVAAEIQRILLERLRHGMHRQGVDARAPSLAPAARRLTAAELEARRVEDIRAIARENNIDDARRDRWIVAGLTRLQVHDELRGRPVVQAGTRTAAGREEDIQRMARAAADELRRVEEITGLARENGISDVQRDRWLASGWTAARVLQELTRLWLGAAPPPDLPRRRPRR